MDQIKIEKFIKELRIEHGLKQRDLAEKLNLSDKTISKWETGNGLPDVEMMLPLSKELGISVNELLSGERLEVESSVAKADENLLVLMDKAKQAKKKYILSLLVGFAVIVPVIIMFMIVSFVDLPDWSRITLLVVSLVVLFIGMCRS